MSTKEREPARKLGLDVGTTGAEAAWTDLGDNSLKGLVASFELKTLVGGTSPDVTPTLEMSPDQSVVYVLKAMAAQSAVGNKEFYQDVNPCFRYVRWSWVTTGTPTSATADAYVEA